MWRERSCHISSIRCFLTCSAETPKTRMILFRLFWPAAILIEDRGTFKTFAKNSIQASFARPSKAGAVSDTFSTSPTSPVMPFFFARGWTLTAKLAPSAMSCTGTMYPQSTLFVKSPTRKGDQLKSGFNPCPISSFSLQRWTFPRARRSILLQLRFQNRATCPSTTHP